MAAAWSEWPAPAKLNLFLRIVGRRADGYHLLQTVFQLLDWGDTVRVRVRRDGRTCRVSALPGVAEDDDLAVRAARALQAAAGTGLGADIEVHKRVPQGGGFGGGSSDAATVLRALDLLWGTDLGPDRLAEIGLALGADVPVFVHGQSAWAEGVGERLEPYRLPDRWFLLLDSGVRVSTGELFQATDLTRDAAPLTMSQVASPDELGNAFEPLLRIRAPRISQALDALSRFGCARVTGTGGGCFVAFDSQDAALEAASVLAPEFPVQVVRGVRRSPLLDALADRQRL
jgi:4-diphosphocytidyl-2-C-methyl-D-erythritol kinase